MRIAIVLNTSWNIYNFRMGLIRSLMQNGHKVITIAPEDEFTEKLINAGCQHEKVTMDSRGANPVKDFALTFELLSIYRRVKPDVVLHFTIKPNIYGTFAARMLNIPSINNVCGLGTVFLKKGLISFIARIMYKLAFRFPNKILFQNREDRDLFINNRLVDSQKTEIVPGSGIDVEHFSPGPSEKKDKFTFLLVSRLIHDKGIVEYIEAIKKLKRKGLSVRFQVLGAIDEKHKRGIKASLVHSWIKENQIEYLGRVNDVRGYIQDADCVVLPSYREGTPRTLLEAASMARPIVTTDVAGCNNVVIDKHNGFLCRLKDPDDLAEKLENMINTSDEERQQMGKNGRARIENSFNENIVIDKYNELIGQFRLKVPA